MQCAQCQQQACRAGLQHKQAPIHRGNLLPCVLPRAQGRHSGHARHRRSVSAVKNKEKVGEEAAGAGRMSPDMVKMFTEAQRNIMELNRSRVNALEELKAARERITELERKLAEEEANGAARLVEAAPAPAQSPPEPTSSPAPAPAPPAAAAPAPQPAGPTITLAYETGWPEVYLHYKVDGEGWTEAPGVRMERGAGGQAERRQLTLRGSRVEFVLNDGGGDWDTPERAHGRNYVIEGPGNYRLKSGKISKLG